MIFLLNVFETVLCYLNPIHNFLGRISPPGSYSQTIPSRSATSGLPPHLPSLLQQTVLNQDPVSDVSQFNHEKIHIHREYTYRKIFNFFCRSIQHCYRNLTMWY